MYREDYSRAGILMLPVVEPDGRVTAQQIVVYTLMPRVLLLSTALILISSVTMEASRRSLKASSFRGYARWLLVTMLLGLAFLASQLVAWKQLARQGVYLASNPHSSFFYLLTATHALHLAVGLLALIFLWVRSRFTTEVSVTPRRQGAADAVSIYWHFMK